MDKQFARGEGMFGSVLAVVYARVSTDEQMKRGHSLPEQVRLCELKARELGATDILVFQDSVSGATLDRPGLSEAREAIKHGVSMFVCLDPDRLARDLMLQLIITDEIETAGTKLVFIQHNYEKTDEGKLFYSVRGAISQYEKAKIAERTLRGKAAGMRVGRLPHGILLFGYAKGATRATLDTHPENAEVVRQIFEWIAAGRGYYWVSKRIEEMGVDAPCGGQRWSRSTLRRIAQNRAYIGEVIVNRVRCLKGGKREERPPEEWVVIPVPPLVSVELFNAVQERRRGLRRTSQPGLFLLSGLCRCGLCGSAVNQTSNSKGRYLRCTSSAKRYEHKDGPCVMGSVKALPVESFVWNAVRSWLTDPDAHLRSIQDRAKSAGTGESLVASRQNLSRYSVSLAEAQAEQSSMIKMLAKGLLDQATAEQSALEIKARIAALRRSIESTEDEIAGIEAQERDIQRTVELADAIRQKAAVDAALAGGTLDALSLERKRSLVRGVVRSVVVYRDQEPKVIGR